MESLVSPRNTQQAESRREANLRNSLIYFKWHILLFLLPESDPMEMKDLDAMSESQLRALYNTLAEKQVKRFESRVKAQERTAQLLREKGELVDEKITTISAKGAANMRETAEAGINDGTPLRKGARGPGAQKSARAAGTKREEAAARAANKAGAKAPERVQEPAKGGKAGKGAAPAGKAAPAAAPASAGSKKGRGAPVKNETYTAIPEGDKKYNPQKLKLQASSARGVVLASIVKAGAKGKTRNTLVAEFPDQNVKSALDVLVKVGFLRIVEEK